ncbi:MAG: hypothetical protein U0470_06240 [Anaerolineae bacterium]
MRRGDPGRARRVHTLRRARAGRRPERPGQRLPLGARVAHRSRAAAHPARIDRHRHTYLGFSCAAPIEPFHAVIVLDSALLAEQPSVQDDLASLPDRVVPAANPFARLGRIDIERARGPCAG